MRTRTFRLRDEAATARLAHQISERARPGDTLLLAGEIGAGKSAFARAFIRHRLGPQEDVPSPTFTLVQTYTDGDTEIWHCDLYRLTDPQEVLELGLDEAFSAAICLIEWPDRLGDLTPVNALALAFEACDDHHRVTLDLTADWAERLAGLDA